MSTNFDLSADTNSSNSYSTNDSSFTFTSSVSNTVQQIPVILSSDEIEYLTRLARKRNRSYQNGETANTVVGRNSSLEAHIMGLKGELAVSKVYGDGTVDESVSAKGDKGVDLTLKIGGKQRDVDVKSNKYSTDAWILLKKSHASWGADAYVSTYTPESSKKVVLTGWAIDDELIRKENLSQSNHGWMNYKLTPDEQRDLPKPDDVHGFR